MNNLIEIRWHGRGGQGAKQHHYYLLMQHLIQENTFKDFQNMDQKEWEHQ